MSEIDSIISGLERISLRAQRRDELARLRESAARQCGNCTHWMKSSECGREKNISGRNYGPSCSDLPCDKFASTASHLGWIEKYEALRKEPLP